MISKSWILNLSLTASTAALALSVQACGPQGSAPAKVNAGTAALTQQAPAPVPGATTQKAKCLPPSILSTAPAGQPVTLSQMLNALSGDFHLEQAHLYERDSQVGGGYMGSFYGIVANPETHHLPPVLEYGCKERSALGGSYLAALKFTVPTRVHAHSGRVTLFDVNTPQADPAINFPTLVDISFDNHGDSSFTHALGRLGGSPYKTHLDLSDALADLPPTTQLFLRTDATGFDIRFEEEVEVAIQGSGAYKSKIAGVFRYGIKLPEQDAATDALVQPASANP